MTEVSDTIRANVRAARKAKGLSRADLAKRLQLSERTVAAYEQGARNIGVNTLAAIAAVLRVPMSELMGYDKGPEG